MSSVVQEWVNELPWKAQSALFSALRGHDGPEDDPVKMVVKWLRMVVQQNADPYSGYMVEGETLGSRFDVIRAAGVKALASAVGPLPVHFVDHLLTALSIIRYHHPDVQTREDAWGLCEVICKVALHVPEPTHEDVAERFPLRKEEVLRD